MSTLRLAIGALALAAIARPASGQQQENPETGAHSAAQAAADALREFTRADGAFLAAALIKTSPARDLAALMQYPSDDVVVLTLTGKQIKLAFERSVSLYPQGNSGFLQISGFEVRFNPNASPDGRVTSVSVGGLPLDERRAYTVAMPTSLARGGFGYFRIWDKANITKTFEGATLETVLRGKTASPTSPRWSASS